MDISFQINEFVNTWSPEGLYEEGIAPAELGWGTHEKTLPPGAIKHSEGPQNQILMRSKGINTFVRYESQSRQLTSKLNNTILFHWTNIGLSIQHHLFVY